MIMLTIERCKIENMCCINYSTTDGMPEVTYVPSPPPGSGWFQINHLSDWRETTWRRITLVGVSA
jgi:hypothetical protein